MLSRDREVGTSYREYAACNDATGTGQFLFGQKFSGREVTFVCEINCERG